jgi:hypothetical protein
MCWRSFLVVPLLVAAGAAQAPSAHAGGGIVLRDGWARATAFPGAVGGGFLTIVNEGATADTLLGASCAGAGQTMLHQTEEKGGVSMMMAVPKLPVPAGATVRFAPGGYHLMMMHLATKLDRGQSVGCTLDFAKAGKLPITLAVEGPGSMGPKQSQ